MDAARGIEIGICRSHHRRHGTSGGETSHEHAGRIDSVFGDDFAGDTSNDGRLTAPAHLILGAKPVPAQRCICGFGLAWISDDKSMLLGESLHAGTCREIVDILRAAMQHDEQGASTCLRMTGNIELVLSLTGLAGKGPAQELSPVRDLERLAWPTVYQPIKAEGW